MRRSRRSAMSSGRGCRPTDLAARAERSRCATSSSPPRWMLGSRCGMLRKPPPMRIRVPRCTMTGPAPRWTGTPLIPRWTGTPLIWSPPSSPEPPDRPPAGWHGPPGPTLARRTVTGTTDGDVSSCARAAVLRASPGRPTGPFVPYPIRRLWSPVARRHATAGRTVAGLQTNSRNQWTSARPAAVRGGSWGGAAGAGQSRKLLTPALGGRPEPAGWAEQRRSMAARVSLTGRGRPRGCLGDSPAPSARPAGSR